MAFDPNQHTIDPKTGYMIDKDTGHRVGLENPPLPSAVMTNKDWPKWVPLNESYVERVQPVEGKPADMVKGAPLAHVLHVHGFEHYHVNRGDNVVTVLVHNADEEQLAGATYKASEAADPKAPHADDATKEKVRRDVGEAEVAKAALDAKAAEAAREKLIAEEAARRVAAKQATEAADKEAAAKLAEAAAAAAGQIAATAPAPAPVPAPTSAPAPAPETKA